MTLAHRGVLFLDELGEFTRGALEALRQPLEDGGLTIVRARQTIGLPCRFLLVAAANPCPCGRGRASESCRCDPAHVSRYEAKLSGALADRIDMFLSIGQPPAEALAGEPEEASADVRARVIEARERQAARLGDSRCNADMKPRRRARRCRLDPEAKGFLAERPRPARPQRPRTGTARCASRGRSPTWMRQRKSTPSHVAEALNLRKRGNES